MSARRRSVAAVGALPAVHRPLIVRHFLLLRRFYAPMNEKLPIPAPSGSVDQLHPDASQGEFYEIAKTRHFRRSIADSRHRRHRRHDAAAQPALTRAVTGDGLRRGFSPAAPAVYSATVHAKRRGPDRPRSWPARPSISLFRWEKWLASVVRHDESSLGERKFRLRKWAGCMPTLAGGPACDEFGPRASAVPGADLVGPSVGHILRAAGEQRREHRSLDHCVDRHR